MCKTVSVYRRARACPSPCLDRNGNRPWLAFGFRLGLTLAGDRPPRYGLQGRLRFTVGRGPVPRHASVEETALVGVRFSRGSNDRGGQAPALRCARPSPFHRRARACPSPCLDREGNGVGLRAFFARVGRSRGTGPRATVKKNVPFTVGRGPVPRRASVGRETALVGMRFLRWSNARGGQAPALRARKGFASLCARSGSGDPERRSSASNLANRDNRVNPAPIWLQALGHASDRGGQAPALRYARPSPFTVGRGPVPRHAIPDV